MPSGGKKCPSDDELVKMTPKQQIIDVIKQRIESLTRAIEIISEYDDLKLTEHGMESVKEELETLLIWVQESM